MGYIQQVSIGDVLMLSQVAWKISRAFANNKHDGAAEFSMIQVEADYLQEALKNLAETLQEDDGLRRLLGCEARATFHAILDSARKTLGDLESLIERYQMTRKRETGTGWGVERVWSDVVIAGYRQIKWTAEGGSIFDLRDLLHLQAESIRVALQAVQSRSPSVSATTMAPVAAGMSSVHERGSQGDFTPRMDDLHRMITSLAHDFTSLSPLTTTSSLLATPESEGRPPSNAAPLSALSLSRPLDSSSSNIAAPSNALSPSSAPTSPRSKPMPEHEENPQRNVVQPLRELVLAHPVSPYPLHSPPPESSTKKPPRALQPPHAQEPGRSANAGFSRAESSLHYDNDNDHHHDPNPDADADVTTAYFSPDPKSVPLPLPKSRHGRPHMDWSFETGSPPDSKSDIAGEFLTAGTSPCDSAFVGSPRESTITRRDPGSLPNLLGSVQPSANSPPNSSWHPIARSSTSSPVHKPANFSHRLSGGAASQLLPPPAISSDSRSNAETPATPLSFLTSNRHALSNVVDDRPPPSRAATSPRIPGRSSARSSIREPTSPLDRSKYFETQLFRNAVILCDVRGIKVEHAQPNHNEPDPRFNIDMIEAAQEARICVIRKREYREHTGTKVATSVWVLSDDGKTRMQQKLSEVEETIPYCSYFDPEKVSLQSVDNQIRLRFHGEGWGDMLLDEVRTSWVNYIFADEDDAVKFQSAVFGRTLLGSYRTTKTTVIHEGLKGAFAFEEQFANIEMLRLWEDDGMAIPGASGGVMALMHVSSSFGDGWARWWINNAKQTVRVKEDGFRHAKVKGIDLAVIKPRLGSNAADRFGAGGTATVFGDAVSATMDPKAAASNLRKSPYKRVTGVRIEFKTEDERTRFVRAAGAAQARLVELPDL